MEMSGIELIIQGGAVGISTFLIWVLWQQSKETAARSKDFTKAMLEFNGSIVRMEDNHNEIKQIIRENSQVIKENSETLRDVKNIIKELK